MLHNIAKKNLTAVFNSTAEIQIKIYFAPNYKVSVVLDIVVYSYHNTNMDLFFNFSTVNNHV